MGMTITEKLLARAADRDSVAPGDLIMARVDFCLGNDITAPVAIDEFEKAGFDSVFDRGRIALIPDHFTPNKDIKAATLVKQMREMGLADVRFLAGDAVNNPEFAQIAGAEAAAGSLISTFPLPRDLQSPEAVAFGSAYEARYGEAPQSIYTLMAADGFRLLVDAMKETGSVDPADLAAHLHAIQDYPGISGPIEGYDEKGDRMGAGHVVYVVTEEGDFELFKP